MPQPKTKSGGGISKRPARPASKTGRDSAGGSDKDNHAPKTTGKGWGAVIAKKKQSSQGSKSRPAYMNVKNKFFLGDGETAIIQILNDEPVCVEGCTLPPENRDFYVSHITNGSRHCPLIEFGLKPVWKAGFEVLDFRGPYDTEKKKHLHHVLANDDNMPVEKYWLVSQTVAQQLKTLSDKKEKPLSEMVLEITRSGFDKKTVYSIEIARDKSDNKVEPFDDWTFGEESKLPRIEEVLKPLPVKVLDELLGNGEADDDDDAEIDSK